MSFLLSDRITPKPATFHPGVSNSSATSQLSYSSHESANQEFFVIYN
ncbi:hypothetical protein [Nostoc sp. TCL26-01]|nr:hypothetical protein [Nostoc sp. TCL26-01]